MPCDRYWWSARGIPNQTVSYASWAFLGSAGVFGVCSCLYRHSDFGYVRSLRASQVICITIWKTPFIHSCDSAVPFNDRFLPVVSVHDRLGLVLNLLLMRMYSIDQIQHPFLCLIQVSVSFKLFRCCLLAFHPRLTRAAIRLQVWVAATSVTAATVFCPFDWDCKPTFHYSDLDCKLWESESHTLTIEPSRTGPAGPFTAIASVFFGSVSSPEESLLVAISE